MIFSSALLLACGLLATPIIKLSQAAESTEGNIPQTTTQGPAAISKFPTVLNHINLVNQLKSAASPSLLKSYITTLTQFPERYYTSKNGLASAQWIL